MKAAADLCAAAELKAAPEMPQGSIAARVKDKAVANRMIADKKAVAGLKALADMKPGQGRKPSEDFVTPVKAACGKTRDRGSGLDSKKTFVLNFTPVMMASDSAAKEDIEARALYDRAWVQLDEEYSSKTASLHTAANVKFSAYERAHAEYTTAHSRATAGKASRTSVQFVHQLRDASLGIYSDYCKTVDVIRAIKARYVLKFNKLDETLKSSSSS